MREGHYPNAQSDEDRNRAFRFIGRPNKKSAMVPRIILSSFISKTQDDRPHSRERHLKYK